jgi:hypothetical protein
MIQEFQDAEGAPAHNRFQAWRTGHQRGVFLTLTNPTHANLHGARCQHFGSGPPYFLSDDGLGSLTSRKKVCGAELALLSWAKENGVPEVLRCKQCVQKGLIKAQPPMPPISIERPDNLEVSGMRYWTSYWRENNWLVNEEYASLRGSGGSFRKRGVSKGDSLYVVSLRAGQLLLGGRMTVDRIVTRQEAQRILHRKNLYDAEDWAIAKDGSGTPLHHNRQLAPEVAKQLRFLSGRPELLFTNGSDLDRQTLRVPRELTNESSILLDDIIEMNEAHGHTPPAIVISDDQLRQYRAERDLAFALHEEIWNGSYTEGSVKQVLVNRYERDPHARRACIRHHGTKCSVCDTDLNSVYGPVAAGFIHVHHLLQLSNIGSDYAVDPVHDLRPVCPSCHGIIHRRNPPYSIDEVKCFVASCRSIQK